MWPMFFFVQNWSFCKNLALYFDNEINKFDNKTF